MIIVPGSIIQYRADPTDPASKVRRGKVSRVLVDDKGRAFLVEAGKNKATVVLDIQLC